MSKSIISFYLYKQQQTKTEGIKTMSSFTAGVDGKGPGITDILRDIAIPYRVGRGPE